MSRSVLHDWECAIEELGGGNANQLLDIAQDIYNTGYVRGKNHATNVLEDIKTEIEEQVLESLSDCGDDWFASEKVNECLEIIDKALIGSTRL